MTYPQDRLLKHFCLTSTLCPATDVEVSRHRSTPLATLRNYLAKRPTFLCIEASCLGCVLFLKHDAHGLERKRCGLFGVLHSDIYSLTKRLHPLRLWYAALQHSSPSPLGERWDEF